MHTIVLFFIISGFILFPTPSHSEDPEEVIDPETALHLPASVVPQLGCWFWKEREFEPDGYREFLDTISRHAPYQYLTTSLRVPMKELIDRDVHDQIQAAATYARERGIGIVMDLDVRLARRAFQSLYPDELQQMLRLREAELNSDGYALVEIPSQDLGDHYTFRTEPYLSLKGEFIRAYAYRRGAGGILAESLCDITDSCVVDEATAKSVRVRVAWNDSTDTSTTQPVRVCIMVSFTHLTPDVFAPHLMDFQRELLNQYRDAHPAGACKDEWGFPPCFDGNPEKNDYWYSRYFAEDYAERTGGRDFIADALLMHVGIEGKESERIAAINHNNAMASERNAALEHDYYLAIKEILGPEAIVATHPTWWPYPDSREMKKNGLDWWQATRDWAQTDETTPFAVRTALAKKWNSSVWYNMYYSSNRSDYERHVWTHALAGGRINYHPLWPHPDIDSGSYELLRGDLMRAECRVRLLNFITRSPLDCPVAVIFGHACAMNWAGPGYQDVGMELADALWNAGIPTDLIPSTEISNGSLKIDEDGFICYGPQRYQAVILYHPEFEDASTAEWFQQTAESLTALFCIGDWTRNFAGEPIEGNSALPSMMSVHTNAKAAFEPIVNALKERDVILQTPADELLEGFDHVSACPRSDGFCRLIDGTVVYVAGNEHVAGDPIHQTSVVDGVPVALSAEGLAAVRLDEAGNLEALAAGGLHHIKAGETEITLERPIDMALWKDEGGEWHGVVQELRGPIPDTLLAWTNDWHRLRVPVPLGRQP